MTSIEAAIVIGTEFNDTIRGSNGADYLDGGDGADNLDGGKGSDTLAGGPGSDIYKVDSAGDQTREDANRGADTVLASANYVLLPGQSIEVLATYAVAGTTPIHLGGNELAQQLNGNNGDNLLSGGGGADTMYGFGGNDSFVVDNPADRIVEAASQGSDTVFASISYALNAGQSVELLATNAIAGVAAISLTGNELAQRICGNNGHNTMNGGVGADTLYGFGGNGTFVVDNAGDQVFETSGQGADTLFASASYALLAGQSVDTLATTLAAGTTSINLTGNNLGQLIYGNAGNNVITGGGGHDVITPNGGADRIAFTAVADSTGLGRDLLVGLNLGGVDKLDFPTVPSAIATEVTTGALTTGNFDTDLASAIGAGQLGIHQAVLFDPSAGDLNVDGRVFLVIDANGVAGYQGGADYVVEFQKLTGTLTTDDFI